MSLTFVIKYIIYHYFMLQFISNANLEKFFFLSLNQGYSTICGLAIWQGIKKKKKDRKNKIDNIEKKT